MDKDIPGQPVTSKGEEVPLVVGKGGVDHYALWLNPVE